jgi:sodium/hydrogen exchanger-like protein 6/7
VNNPHRTLTKFHGSEIHVLSIFHGIGIFLATFGISMALGVVFGLGVSLLLKHSSLNRYPHIETCLVALAAYTSYFLSNGLSMSGIVSLLFCGITLKHYAYHTMSRRTQRATKYIFSTLAQLTENFIFIYLGLSLFTSAPSSEPVTHYVKPIFIVVTTVAVMFTRYAAVFPLSEMINFFHKHARGQRHEEIPHSYQMMLFWAGLRGAVGVALAAGFPGDNAQPLRTTVLVVVVLTVVLFGGTTARMLEILGIRTGVEDEAASSSDEEFGSPSAWYRRGNGRNSRARRSSEPFYSPQRGSASRIGLHYGHGPRSYNHQFQHHQSTGTPGAGQNIFSAASSDSYDSDGEVLPMATTNIQTGNDQNASGSNATPNLGLVGPPRGRGGDGNGGGEDGIPVVEEGKWFQELDERYLLPLFSNATASRTFHARRARRSQQSGIGSPFVSSPMDSGDEGEEGEEVDLGGGSGGGGGLGGGGRGSGHGGRGSPAIRDEARFERGLSSPMLRRDSEGNRGGP